MAKVNGWSWMKERMTEFTHKYTELKQGVECSVNDSIDYHELFGIKEKPIEMPEDQYYQKLLRIKHMPLEGSLSNEQARQWYLYYMAKIPEVIEKRRSIEAQGRQASELRNWLRTKTRKLMADRELAVELDLKDRNLTYDEVRTKQISRGLTGDLTGEGIIRGSCSSRDSINQELGVAQPPQKEIDPLWAHIVLTPERRDQKFEEMITKAKSVIDPDRIRKRNIVKTREIR